MFINFTFRDSYLSDTTLKILLITIGTLLAIGLVANVYTLGNLFAALIFSQRRHLQRSIARLESLKSEGFLQALKGEVTLMTEMVIGTVFYKCLSVYTFELYNKRFDFASGALSGQLYETANTSGYYRQRIRFLRTRYCAHGFRCNTHFVFRCQFSFYSHFSDRSSYYIEGLFKHLYNV